MHFCLFLVHAAVLITKALKIQMTLQKYSLGHGRGNSCETDIAVNAATFWLW